MGFGFRVQGLGFRGFRIQGLGFRVLGCGLGTYNLGYIASIWSYVARGT